MLVKGGVLRRWLDEGGTMLHTLCLLFYHLTFYFLRLYCQIMDCTLSLTEERYSKSSSLFLRKNPCGCPGHHYEKRKMLILCFYMHLKRCKSTLPRNHAENLNFPLRVLQKIPCPRQAFHTSFAALSKLEDLQGS